MTSKMYKFWTTTGERKAVAASSFEQFLSKGAAKCSRSVDDIVRITIEDGTELDADDEDVFKLLSPESPLIVEFKAVDSDEQHDMNAYFTTPQSRPTDMETAANSNMAEDEVTNANPTSSAEDERNGADVASGGDARVDAFGTATSQLATGELDYEGFLLTVQAEAFRRTDRNHPNYAEIKNKIKKGNAERRRTQSSAAYQKVLEELYKPIKEKLSNGSYDGEGGSLAYQQDMEDLKQAYLANEDLGPVMKSAELDKFIDNHSGELATVENLDRRATEKEETQQAQLLTLLLVLLRLFKELEKAYQAWMDTRSDTINWFNATADTLDGKRMMGNKADIGTASVGLAAGATGIAVVSVALAPVTFGASLALGLGIGSAAVGIAAGGTGLVFKMEERKYNTQSEEEQKNRIQMHNKQIVDIENAIAKLQEHAEEMRKTLVAQFETESSSLKQMSAEGRTRKTTENVKTGAQVVGTVAKVTNAAARPVRLLIEIADDAINAAKMTGQVADDVLNAAKAGFVASKALGGLAIGLGVIGIGFDAFTLGCAIKDMKAGSKSELATKFREKATELKTNTDCIITDSEEYDQMVKQAEELIRPLLKRYSLNLERF